MALSVIKNANLALTFFLELGVLVALGYWGFQTGQGTGAKFALGLGAPAAAIVLWALFGAPRGRWHLKGIWRVLLQIVFFGSAALALAAAVTLWLGITWALICILNIALNYAWKQ
ncbi:MAG TPA: YrdB family protein [Ktedonobacterales bacterium]|nr:YrdB family protein [Ktedonobacterales bacterium]